MESYRVKAEKIIGTNYKEVLKKARHFYSKLCSTTKRKPYIRSNYFRKEKIFLDLFWAHLYEKKSRRDRIRRLKFLPCAIELIQVTTSIPSSKINPNHSSEKLHRFMGLTKESEQFCVQIKESINSNKKKWFISVFPFD